MVKSYNWMIGLIILIVIFFFVFQIINSNSKIKLINANEFEDLISSDEVFVINVHTPYIGEIKGTDLVAERWENMASYINQLPKNKDAPIAIYCRSGTMSRISAQQLSDLGYTNIYDLNGGMKAWEASGKEIIFN